MFDALNGLEIFAPKEAFDKGFKGDYCTCDYPYIRNSNQSIQLSNATWQKILESEL